MLDKDTAKILENNVVERINKMFPKDSDGFEKLSNSISLLAVRATIMTLQEYEKLTNTD